MKKLNRKGFTLIEMLVVIAIIAILVAIIIPIVSSSTTKAAAAANAANMRSLKSEITTSFVSNGGTFDDSKDLALGSDKKTVTLKTDGNIEYPEMKAVGDVVGSGDAGNTGSSDTKNNWLIEYDGNEFEITYGGKTIAWFADVAASGDTNSQVG